MEIKNKKSFNDLIRSLSEEILDEEELDEITATGDVAGYSTPKAFGKTSKKKKKNLEKQTGYKFVTEALNDADIKKITKLIRAVVADVLRDIWLKRASWKKI